VYSKDSDRDIQFFVIDDAESLRYVANMGTIPIHMWSSRSGSLERPDWLVLDLDPKGAPFAHVVEVARALAHDPRGAGAAEPIPRPPARPGSTS
jgi:bifunctional non-homologous end joining protein LigD